MGATYEKLAFCRDLRKKSTPAERKLWGRLRNRQLLGIKFRRQHVVLGYIADFYAAALNLIIELDGDSHEHRKGYDAARDERLEREGAVVLRFGNDDVLERESLVIGRIADTCRQLMQASESPLPQTGEGDW